MKLNKNELIITIDSEPGCNGDWIGKRMSNILEIPCYGKEILNKAGRHVILSQHKKQLPGI